MAKSTGSLAISQGPPLMVKSDQWNVLHNRNGSK